MFQKLKIELIAGLVVSNCTYIPPINWDEDILLPTLPPVNIFELKSNEFEDYVNKQKIINVLSQRTSLKIADCLFYEKDIRGINNIVGYRISSSENRFAMGLSEVHSEYKSSSGYKHCLSLPLEDDNSEEARVIRTNQINDIPPRLIEKVKHKLMLIQNDWNYSSYNKKIFEIALTTRHILSQLEFDAELSDIKLMIVWCWK
ncbi:hypothetical protein CAL7716_102450 (plasmid) [Calothrix sp. PCC 7716]|nr:hypothetical protein CAL7716_102450 [Calothrix sp. PCC 7716]